MTKRRTPIDLFSLSCLFWKYYIKIVPKIVLPRISCIFKGTKIWGWPLSTLPMSHCSFMTHGLLSFNYHLTSLLNTLTQSCWCTQKGPTSLFQIFYPQMNFNNWNVRTVDMVFYIQSLFIWHFEWLEFSFSFYLSSTYLYFLQHLRQIFEKIL